MLLPHLLGDSATSGELCRVILWRLNYLRFPIRHKPKYLFIEIRGNFRSVPMTMSFANSMCLKNQMLNWVSQPMHLTW